MGLKAFIRAIIIKNECTITDRIHTDDLNNLESRNRLH